MPGRPLPSRPVGETVRAWLQWFGLARLVVTGGAVLAVGAGAFWLLRAPATPVEQTLPMADRAATTSTLRPTSTSVTSSTSATEPAEIVVHVAGAVVNAGVYRLLVGARAEDAVALAGGVSPDADTDALNLAAPLHDGDRLYVPHVGQPVPTMVVPSGGATAGGGGTAGTAVTGPIDLNRATADQLDALPGIGPATAAAIVAYRNDHGPFSSVDDLLQVRGIGPAKLDAIRALVIV